MTALGLGVVGAGRFATFVAGAVTDLPGVSLRAVADRDTEAAAVLAKAYDATAHVSVEALLADDDVDVVVVATPPASHAGLATAALEAGKHVFCEKPLATSADELAALVAAAGRTDRVLVVDHVLRFNPVLRALSRLQDKVLGQPQRFLFENDASDEDLDDEHWFWDETRSGGIFVEHGVHFFDAAAFLVGRAPSAVQATEARRTGTGLVDLVSATVRHGRDMLATHTHSFTHAHRCERQLMRLDYGTAEARVEGWIPVVATVDLWTDDAGLATCETLTDHVLDVEGFRPVPGTSLTVRTRRDRGTPAARGRGHDLQVPHHVRIGLTLGGHEAKAGVYAESVRAAMADLVRSVTTGSRPHSGLAEGAAAVEVALAAAAAARTGTTVTLSGDET